MLKLEIYSDPVCPWCYVGKSQLDSTLAESKLESVTISWRPFQLNPDMPVQGMDRGAYLRRKFRRPDLVDLISSARIADILVC